MKRNLTNLKQRITLGDKQFILSALTLEAKENVEALFAQDGFTYNDAVGKMFQDGDVKLTLKFLYGLILNDNPFKDFEEFKSYASKNLKPSELSTIIENVIYDSTPDFAITEKKSLLRNLTGWLIILLAMIGMIHSLSWLVDCISNTPSFLVLPISKFSEWFSLLKS